jgi:hypothetical protein
MQQLKQELQEPVKRRKNPIKRTKKHGKRTNSLICQIKAEERKTTDLQSNSNELNIFQAS